MATIVTSPQSDGSGAAGWMVAVIVLLVVLVGGYFAWAHFGSARSVPDTANINVTVPDMGGEGGGMGAGQ